MALKWTSKLAVGVDKIDEQHRGLFDTLNSLHCAMKDKKGLEEILKVLQFLSDYVVTHFATEEKLMEKYDYPGFKDHKRKHDEFVENFIELKGRVENEGVKISSVIRTNKLLSDWWMEHIKKVDIDTGAYLSTKMDK